MNVLLLDQFAELGGAQRCLLETARALREAGWEVHGAIPGPGPLVTQLERRGAFVQELHAGSYSLGRKRVAEVVRYFLTNGALACEIRDLVRRARADLLYVNGPRLLPAVARAGLGVPVVFHCHNRISSAAARALAAWAAQKANATVVAAAEVLARRWPRAKVVYGGVEGPAPGWVHKGGSVGMIARFHPNKGQREFVAAAAQVAAQVPDARFVLCGDAIFQDRRARRYQADVLSRLPAQVRYGGWREDVYGVLADLDLLVLPSRDEGGVPNVVLEAFAAGVPVLATPAGGIPEVIEDGRTGFLLSSPRPEEVAGRMRELLRQRELLRVVAGRARQLWRERFTAELYRRQIAAAVGAAVGDHLSPTG